MVMAVAIHISPRSNWRGGEGEELIECTREDVIGYPDVIVYVVSVRMGVSVDMSG